MSSFINKVTFRGDTRGIMTVTLRDNRDYEYDDVPRKVYNDFMKAESKGKFFNENVRNSNFKVS